MNGAMPLLPLLRTAGALPLAQLAMRASGGAAEVLGELQALVQEGLVTVEGNQVPETVDQLRTSRAVAKLTHAGTSRAFR
jgi:hypothetical protein